VFYVDKVGRKPLITLCPAFCAITLIIYAVLVKVSTEAVNGNKAGTFKGRSNTSKARVDVVPAAAGAVAFTYIFMAGYICVEGTRLHSPGTSLMSYASADLRSVWPPRSTGL
jgi:hypothetical protein